MLERFKNNSITREQLDSQDLSGPKIKGMIYDGELYILSDAGFADPPDRGMATAHAINRAINAISPSEQAQLPNCEFIIFVNDHAAMFLGKKAASPPVWSYTKTVA